MNRFLAALLMLAAALPAATAEPPPSRYASVMNRPGGVDSLLSLAAWEDGRVTGNGKLFRYLQSTEPLLRLRAVEVIGRIQDPGDAPHLIRMLSDPDHRVVAEAIFATGQLGTSTAVAALDKLNGRTTTPQRCLIAEALGKIGSARTVEILQRMLQDTLSNIRQNAALGLARCGDAGAIPSLLFAIHDPDPEVVWRAVYALEKNQSKRIVHAVAPLLEHDQAVVRAFTVRTLGKQTDYFREEHTEPEAAELTRRLIALLEDGDHHVVVNCARALGALKVNAAVHPLGTLLKNSRSHHVRREAARALGSIGGRNGKDYLIEACSDGSAGVRTEAIQSLARVLGNKAGMFIRMLLQDGDRAVKAAALESYGLAHLTDGIDLLLEYAIDEKDALLQAAAVRSLAQFGDAPEIAPALTALLAEQNCDWVVATEAVTALKTLDARSAIPQLIETCEVRNMREDGNIRIAILDALTAFAATEAAELAERALEDSDPRIRTRARSLLTTLGHPLPDLQSDRYYYERDYNPARKRAVSLPLGLRRATIATTRGSFVIELFGDDATQTVDKFMKLGNSGAYNQRTFHRVVPNFVVQGGCPRGDGWGDDGYYLRSEFTQHRYGRGYVGIAHDGKDTGGSQFFITHSPQHHLDGRYTIFGRVVSGMEVVDQIDQGDTFRVTLSGWD